MKVFKSISEVHDQINDYKKRGKTIGLVPTMGALHQGHLSLIKLAAQNADKVIVSIYVNPTQFGPNEDFAHYPRTLEADLEKCEELGVSAIFTPTDEIMYGSDRFLSIHIERINKYMDGGSRPGFFEGIVLVVNKLFNITKPDVAVFGQKDIQQFRILQQMVLEFNHGVELIMGPIIRAVDGLALSSRNAYLDDEQRLAAPGLFRSLCYIKKQIEDGVVEPGLLIEHQKMELAAKKLEIDYLDLFSFDEIVPDKKLVPNRKYILAGAVYSGKTRLIDNLIIEG